MTTLFDLWQDALITMAKVGGPFVLMALAVGLLTSIIQAATQLQENILSFAPKLAAVGLVLALAGTWVFSELVQYTERAAAAVVRIGQGGDR